MVEECDFNGSNLETTINNERDNEKIKKLFMLTKSALETQSQSKFWQEAFDLIETKYKKLKND
jgi:hypothetical protein